MDKMRIPGTKVRYIKPMICPIKGMSNPIA
jgi:hypothetical protein